MNMKVNITRKLVHRAILATLLGFIYANATFRFTNIICTEVDKNYIKFEYCYIKAYNRSYKYLSLKAKLLQVPVTNSIIRIALLKRANGYKPFLYNITFDGCKFHLTKNQNPIAAYFYSLFKDYSNLNHTCPYYHDIIVEKLDTSYLDYRMTQVLPVPRGQYCLHHEFFDRGILRVIVEVYAELT